MIIYGGRRRVDVVTKVLNFCSLPDRNPTPHHSEVRSESRRIKPSKRASTSRRCVHSSGCCCCCCRRCKTISHLQQQQQQRTTPRVCNLERADAGGLTGSPVDRRRSGCADVRAGEADGARRQAGKQAGRHPFKNCTQAGAAKVPC